MSTFSVMDSESFGEMEHRIDFTDAKIVETCRPLAAVMNDDTVHGDVWSAARANDFDSLRRLLKDGNSVDEINGSGVTPLHLCASLGHAKLAQYLISKGANVHKCDHESGWTPLHRALYNKRIGVALMLIENGAKLDAPARQRLSRHMMPGEADRDGNTPLDLVSLPLRDILHAATGSSRAMRIGNVFTFGQFQQQLGYGIFGKTHVQNSPRRVDALSRETVVGVSAAKYNTFAVAANGNLYAWGVGRGGRLGTGDERTHLLPILIEGPFMKRRVSKVSTAKHHTLAITSTGQLFSWGGEKFGKLGHHSEKTLDEDKICTYPKFVEGDLKKKVVVAIAAGLSHSVAVTEEGHLYTWGSNENGQLGHYHPNNVKHKKKKTKNLSTSFSTNSNSNNNNSNNNSNSSSSNNNFYISRGRSNSSNNNNNNNNNQINSSSNNIDKYNSNTNENNPKSDMKKKIIWPLPTRVAALSVPKRDGRPRKVAKVSANEVSTCVVQSSGRVWQWGHDFSQPSRVSFPGAEELRKANGLSPVQHGVFVIPRAIRIVDVACTRDNNIAVSTSGDVYSWRSNVAPPLVAPKLIRSLRGKHVTKIAAGLTHVAAVIDTGDLVTWDLSSNGNGNSSGLGHVNKAEGGGLSTHIPQSVHTLKRVTAVACGDTHTAAIVTLSRPRLENIDGMIIEEKEIGNDLACNTVLNEYHSADETVENEDSTFDLSISNTDGGESDTDDTQSLLNGSVDINVTQDFEDDKSFGQHLGVKSRRVPSLQKLCEVSLAKLVDAHNFADILAYGEAFNCQLLSNYCKEFLLLNLDAILVAARPRELSILRFQTSVGMVGSEHEEQLFDFIEEYFQEESPRLHPKPPPLPVPTQQAKILCSKTPTSQSVRVILRRVKAIRKKLMQISRLEKLDAKKLTGDQKIKIERKALLSTELKELDAWLLLSPELVDAETKRKELLKKDNLHQDVSRELNFADSMKIKKIDMNKKNKYKGNSGECLFKMEKVSAAGSATRFCTICNVELMDEAAYQSHVGGKRHKKQMVKHQKCANKTKEKHDSSKVSKSKGSSSGGPGTALSSKNSQTPSQPKPRRLSWNNVEAKVDSGKKKATSLLTIMMQESQQGDNSSNDSTKGPSNLPAKNADANTQTGWKQMQWKTKREKKSTVAISGPVVVKKDLLSLTSTGSKPISIPNSANGNRRYQNTPSKYSNNSNMVKSPSSQQQYQRFSVGSSPSSQSMMMAKSSSPVTRGINISGSGFRRLSGYGVSPKRNSYGNRTSAFASPTIGPSSIGSNGVKSPMHDSPSLSLGSFIQHPSSYGSPDKASFSPWGTTPPTNVASNSLSSRRSTPQSSPPAVSLMEIMEVEAKKKKEEKYTNARLDRHQTKWYQRDEDTKQASLEAIMKNEQAEAKKREEEKKMLNDERKRKEKAKKSSAALRAMKKGKADRQRNRRRKSKKDNNANKSSNNKKTKKSGLSKVIMPTSINF